MVESAITYAASIGYTYEYANLRQYGREAMCHASSKTIFMQPGLLPRKERFLAWHEIGHALLGHEPTMFERINKRQELAADEWAAHMLIPVQDYIQAEEKYGTNTEWIAEELDVLEKAVIAYERTLHRIGDTVYVKPRMGAGQWVARIPA